MYYDRIYGDLIPGGEAKVNDIDHSQSNIEDGMATLLNDLHNGTSFILGSNENDFIISPAPKRGNLYVDTQNQTISENFTPLSIKNTGYKQKIRKSKTSLYSINIKLRNLYYKSITVWFEIRDPNEDDALIAKQSVEVPPNTDNDDFEVVFAQEYLPTALGITSEDAENNNVYLISDIVTENPESINENLTEVGSLGISEYDFIVKPLNMDFSNLSGMDDEFVVTPDTFAIFADTTGGYGKKLFSTNNDGLIYEKTDYDLVFRDVYSTAPTYLCTGGSGVIDGQKVDSIQTHIEIQGGSRFGDVISLVYMDTNGYYQVGSSNAFFNIEEPGFPDVEDKILPIAFVTTYVDNKPPKIEQEDINQIVRPRSLFERQRRTDKKINYDMDLNIPPRFKRTLSGEHLLSDGSEDTCLANGIRFPLREDGQHVLTTDSKGNLVYKATNADTFNIPITFKENLESNIGTNAAKNIVKNTHVKIESNRGLVALDTYVTKEAKSVLKNTTSSNVEYNKALENISIGNKAIIDKTIGVKSKYDPWSLMNSPDKATKPKERIFNTYSGITSLKQKKLSEYPATTLTMPKPAIIKRITIPITKFRNMKNFKIAIFRKNQKDSLKDDVLIDLPPIYESGYVSLDNARRQNGYQILSRPNTFTLGKDGVKFDKGQYVVVVFGNPINKMGSIITATVPTLNKKDYLIRYRGTTRANTFKLKSRVYETWFDETGSIEVDWLDYYRDGSIESGTINFGDDKTFNIASANIASILPTGSISVPRGCSYQLWVKTNQVDWTRAALGKSLNISGTQFQWKLDLKGTDEETPVIDTNRSSTGYGLQFAITMQSLNDYSVGIFDDTGECFTTKIIRGENILADYINDPDFNVTGRFSRYEFIRLWAEENAGKIVCDIQASNQNAPLNLNIGTINPYGSDTGSVPQCLTKTGANYFFNKNVDIFSLIYADLTLDDFTYKSVDYSNYDPTTEYDEHNFRLKLDAETTHNDADVNIFNSEAWKSFLPKYDKDSTNKFSTDSQQIYINAKENGGMETGSNTILSKIQPLNFVDLSKFSALKLTYKLLDKSEDPQSTGLVNGLGLYISLNNETEGPIFSNVEIGDIINGKEVIREENVLPPNLNQTQGEQIDYYFNKILEILVERDNVIYKVYYEYYIDASGQYQYRMVQNVRSYVFYKLPQMKASSDIQTIIIPIERDDWFKYVREIGIVAITKTEETPQFSGVTSTLQLYSLSGQVLGYNKIYDGQDPTKWKVSNSTEIGDFVTIGSQGSTDKSLKLEIGIDNEFKKNSLINKQLIHFNNDSFTQGFNHLGLQLATSHLLYKGMFKLNFHDAKDGMGNIVFSLDIPSLNYIQNPATVNDLVKFTQIYKKINKNHLIKSLSISTGPTFRFKLDKLLGNTNSGKITLYMKDIMLYEASTMPILHKNIRAKIYSKSEGGSFNLPTLRKFGVVATYN
jgi:hypothetical protein